jgi:hypothetical protein
MSENGRGRGRGVEKRRVSEGGGELDSAMQRADAVGEMNEILEQWAVVSAEF